MGNHAVVIPFRSTKRVAASQPTSGKIVNFDKVKHFTEDQIRFLRRTVRNKAILDKSKGNITGLKEWPVVDLLTSSGLRVSEAANLRCGDVKANYGQRAVFVRCGKNRKSRTVVIPESLKRNLVGYISWKKQHGESVGPDDFVFVGKRGPWTAQGIQQVVKKYLKELGLYESGKSVHALRHSYAFSFYRKNKDIKSLQILLGHSSIQTTEIYTHVSEDELLEQTKNLWGN